MNGPLGYHSADQPLWNAYAFLLSPFLLHNQDSNYFSLFWGSLILMIWFDFLLIFFYSYQDMRCGPLDCSIMYFATELTYWRFPWLKLLIHHTLDQNFWHGTSFNSLEYLSINPKFPCSNSTNFLFKTFLTSRK